MTTTLADQPPPNEKRHPFARDVGQIDDRSDLGRPYGACPLVVRKPRPAFACPSLTRAAVFSGLWPSAMMPQIRHRRISNPQPTGNLEPTQKLPGCYQMLPSF